MTYTATGTIIRIDFEREITEKFIVRTFILEIADKPEYPQRIQFQTAGKANRLLDGLIEGETVTVHFDLRGKEGRPKPDGEKPHYNTLQCFKIEKV